MAVWAQPNVTLFKKSCQKTLPAGFFYTTKVGFSQKGRRKS